jgi:hypothetical protein
MNTKNKINWIIIHHTGGTELDPLADTSNHTFEIVNAWHRNDPHVWLGHYSSLGFAIGYHYFIDKTGKLTQGRKDGEQAAHTKGYNNNLTDPDDNSAIGICLAGNFDVTFPTKEQTDTLKKLLNEKRKEHIIPRDRIVPHNRFSKKTCYGRNLDPMWASNLTVEEVNILDPMIHTCVAEEAEIKQLKERLKWYEIVLNFFFGNRTV